MKPLAALAKEQLSEVGITVEIKEHAPDTYWSEAYTVEPFTVGYYAIDSTTVLLAGARHRALDLLVLGDRLEGQGLRLRL